ncbi:MAG: flavodoxin family protein [Clostridium sp.]|nr:flavodoxin family protein [Clostridium sp.]
MSKIVVLNGSPRKKGNTEILVDAFAKGAESVGHLVSKLSVRDAKVNGCLGCDNCIKNAGMCIQKDGMQKINDALYQADTVVFASPSYYFGWTAQLKAIVDRFYSAGEKPFPVTGAALLMTLAGDAKTDAAAALVNYRLVIEHMKWANKGMVIADGVMDKGDIVGNPALLKAEELGKTI